MQHHRQLEIVPLGRQIGKTEVGLLVREGQYLPLRVREFLSHVDPIFKDWLSERDAQLAKETERKNSVPKRKE